MAAFAMSSRNVGALCCFNRSSQSHENTGFSSIKYGFLGGFRAKKRSRSRVHFFTVVGMQTPHHGGNEGEIPGKKISQPFLPKKLSAKFWWFELPLCLQFWVRSIDQKRFGSSGGRRDGFSLRDFFDKPSRLRYA